MEEPTLSNEERRVSRVLDFLLLATAALNGIDGHDEAKRCVGQAVESLKPVLYEG